MASGAHLRGFAELSSFGTTTTVAHQSVARFETMLVAAESPSGDTFQIYEGTFAVRKSRARPNIYERTNPFFH